MSSIMKMQRTILRLFSKKYSKDHEWILKDKTSKLYSIGISDHAQSKLGGIVYLSFPEVGKVYKAHESMGEIESPKAVSQIYAPASIKITEVNDKLSDDLSVINEKAEETWLYKGELLNEKELAELMDSKAYQEYAKDH